MTDGSEQPEATNRGRRVPRKVETPGQLPAQRILKQHREGTREAPCCSSGEDGWICDTLDLGSSTGKAKRRKSHFAIQGPPGVFANLASGKAPGEIPNILVARRREGQKWVSFP